MSHAITNEQFIERVMRRAGMRDPVLTEEISVSTLRVLGQRLANFEANMIAEQLPDNLANALRADEFESRFDVDAMYARVHARHPDVPAGFVIEQVQAVCHVLGDVLTGPARRRLDILPSDFGALFSGRMTWSGPRPAVDGHPNISEG